MIGAEVVADFVDERITFPRSGLLIPSFGVGQNQVVRASFQHEGSVDNIDIAWILINTSVGARNACYIGYFAPGNLLPLLPDN